MLSARAASGGRGSGLWRCWRVNEESCETRGAVPRVVARRVCVCRVPGEQAASSVVLFSTGRDRSCVFRVDVVCAWGGSFVEKSRNRVKWEREG